MIGLAGGAVFAHGVGGRTDLPVPAWMVGYGAGAALVVSFAALAVFWRDPRLEAARWGPVVAGSSPAARATLMLFRALGVAGLAIVLAAGFFGSDNALENIAPTAVYVTFWVGCTLISGLAGDVYRLIDPYETLGPGEEFDAGASPRFGLWPAAVGLFAFVWLELVYPDPSRPLAVALFVALVTVIVLAGAFRYGHRFLVLGNPFRAWFGLLGAMGVLGDDGRGHVRWRWPLVGLARLRVERGVLAVVMVALGSTAFDGVTRTDWWTRVTEDLGEPFNTVVGTAGLLGCVAIVSAAYLAAMRVSAGLTSSSAGGPSELAGAFVHSLVPIAFAYAIAHYISLLAFEGQAIIPLLSDPFGRGWDLFGTAGHRIDFTWLAPTTIAWVQVTAIVAGHIAGVVLAHDRALALFPASTATRSQYPLLVVMVLFTVAGLGLLLGG